MLTSMQYTLQGLFWDYLALEITLDSIYYSGATELSGWWTYDITWILLDYYPWHCLLGLCLAIHLSYWLGYIFFIDLLLGCGTLLSWNLRLES